VIVLFEVVAVADPEVELLASLPPLLVAQAVMARAEQATSASAWALRRFVLKRILPEVGEGWAGARSAPAGLTRKVPLAVGRGQ
jgi:hypothetical protein